jgi:hypothetical protein
MYEDQLSSAREAVTLRRLLPIIAQQRELHVEPDLPSLLHELRGDHQPVPRDVVRALHNLRHVHELEELPGPERHRRPVGVDAGVELRRLVPRRVLVGIALREGGAQGRADGRQEAPLLGRRRSPRPLGPLDGAVGDVGVKEAEMEDLLGPGPLGDQLGAGDDEDAARGSLVPLRVVLDGRGADARVVLPLDGFDVAWVGVFRFAPL